MRMNESTKIIDNGIVFTGDHQHHAGKLTLLIQGGRIVDIGKPVQILKAMHPSAEIIDANGKVILPGFIDAHHSSETFFLRYLASNYSISRSSKNSIIQGVNDYMRKEASYEDFLGLYRLSYYAAVKSGVTTLAEYGFDTPEYSFSASVEAMRQSNIKGIIGLHNGDQIEAAKKIRDSSLRFACAIADEDNLTTYNFQSTIRNARDHHWPVILQLGQTRHGYEVIKKNFNKSIAQLYADYRALDVPVHLVHLACYEEGDYEIIAKAGVPLIISPVSILHKGTENPPFDKLFRHNIKLVLSSGSENPLPLNNVQAYVFMLRMQGLPIPTANEMLSVCTSNGAQALGLEGEIGTIEIGKEADLVFLNLSDFRLNALLVDEDVERMLGYILQNATSQHVTEVMIHGEFYVRQGLLLTYSEDDLANEAQALLRKMMPKTYEKEIPSSQQAAILQLPHQFRNKENANENEMPFEEGFRVVRKDTLVRPPQKSDVPPERPPRLPDNVRKIFGEDEIG